MSRRRRSGFSAGNGSVSVDLLLESRRTNGFLDEIHLASQQTGKALLKIVEGTEAVEAALRKSVAQPYRSIDVGAGPAVSPRQRSEQRETLYAEPTQFAFVSAQCGKNAISFQMLVLSGVRQAAVKRTQRYREAGRPLPVRLCQPWVPILNITVLVRFRRAAHHNR